MKKRMQTLSLLTTLLVVTLLFSGCLNLKSSPEREVEAFFENVSAAIQSGEPSQVADLWGRYPFIWLGDLVYREDIEGWAEALFDYLDADDRHISVQILALDSLMVFDSGKTSGVIYGAVMTAEGWEEGGENPHSDVREMDRIRVIKIGDTWKFDGPNDLLYVFTGGGAV